MKMLLNSYGVRGSSVEEITREVNRILEHGHRMMQNVLTGSTSRRVRVQFDVSGCKRKPKELLRERQASTVLGSATSLGPVELE